MSAVAANPDAVPPFEAVGATETTFATCQVNNAKLYAPVVTLSINDSFKCSEHLKQGLHRTISWNKYKSEITAQPKNNKLDYMIDPTF